MKSNNTIYTDPLIAGWLLSEYSISSADQWIENIVRQLLDLTKQGVPPIKLEPLFKLRRIINYPKDYSYKWEVRFTMAHEIAHTFWFDLSTSPPRKTFPSVPKYISETLCNAIAAEILMPKYMVKEFLKECFSTAEPYFNIELFRKIVRDFVQKFNVSPNVVIRRLVQDLNLWNVLVLGVSWRSKFYGKEAVRLGKLEIEESGFKVQVNVNRRDKPNTHNKEAWRLEWYAKPSSISNELFIPTTGNPSLHLEIIEELYQSSRNTYCIEKEECLSNFKLGNLTKHLTGVREAKKQYSVYACFLRKVTEDEALLPLQIIKEQDMDYSQRHRSKIAVCIPLWPAKETSPTNTSFTARDR